MSIDVIMPETIYPYDCSVEDVTGNAWMPERSAFIGRVGDAMSDKLYLVTYTQIVLLSNPIYTWEAPKCYFKVTKWVDLEIEVIQ